ncbi:MAG: PIN domain-containing protein [Aquiluna sp.]|jgi:PIN domain nuclease of toxin-antitoxin system|nr:PIN domain-containing protein [Aquiluna sp.]MDP5025757.1 PIN domain-containing protein [Aquiluna sp.]
MRQVLLDSNALYFYLTQSKRVGKKSRSLFELSDVYFSAVSLIELRIKMLAGKLSLNSLNVSDLVARGLQPLDFKVDTFANFELRANTDPFDNMLLAQALHHDFLFLTSDLEILRLNLDYVLDLTD